MTMLARIAFTAAIAAAFAGSAQAQRQRPAQPGQAQPGQQQPGQRGQGGFGGGSLRSMLHTSKPLQEELKLTDDQIAKFKEFAEKNAPMGMGQGGPGGGGFGGGSDLDTLEALKAQVKTVEERIEFVKATLNKDQAERFAQLENQRLGLRAFSTVRIVKVLALTDEQKKRVTEIGADLQKEMQAAGGGFQRGQQPDPEKLAEAVKKRAQLNEYAMEAIEKELTGEQKTNWSKLVGAKFDMSKLTARPATTTN